jgi:hypothetical protein
MIVTLNAVTGCTRLESASMVDQRTMQIVSQATVGSDPAG